MMRLHTRGESKVLMTSSGVASALSGFMPVTHDGQCHESTDCGWW